MDSSVLFEAQQALYRRLDDGLAVPLYDYVPQDAEYPYVSLGDQNSTNADNLNSLREDLFQTLSVWSAYRGQREVRQIIDQVHALLHRTTLAVDSGRVFGLVVTRHRVTRDADELTYMGQITLKMRVER